MFALVQSSGESLCLTHGWFLQAEDDNLQNAIEATQHLMEQCRSDVPTRWGTVLTGSTGGSAGGGGGGGRRRGKRNRRTCRGPGVSPTIANPTRKTMPCSKVSSS